MSLALKKSIIMRLIFDYELDKVAAIEVSSCAYLTSSVHDLEDCHGKQPTHTSWTLAVPSDEHKSCLQKRSYPEERSSVHGKPLPTVRKSGRSPSSRSRPPT